LEDGVELVLLDDVDLVLRPDARDVLRRILAFCRTDAGKPVSFVLTCQDPDRIRDLLPARTHLYALRQPAEVH
jgi:RND superfamily putative drug exporter